MAGHQIFPIRVGGCRGFVASTLTTRLNRQKGNKRTVKIPEEFDAIRIQTIHKSKGLQYKVVLLPYLDVQHFQ